MNHKNISSLNILIAGKGGQGIIVMNQILANVFLEKKYCVKTSEIHGMAQRGGSVVSHLRCGVKIYSPTIPIGKADYILALDENEGLRWEYMLNTAEYSPNPKATKFIKGKILKLSPTETNQLSNIKMKNIALLTHLIFHLQQHPAFDISFENVKKHIEIFFFKKKKLLKSNLELFNKTLDYLKKNNS